MDALLLFFRMITYPPWWQTLIVIWMWLLHWEAKELHRATVPLALHFYFCLCFLVGDQHLLQVRVWFHVADQHGVGSTVIYLRHAALWWVLHESAAVQLVATCFVSCELVPRWRWRLVTSSIRSQKIQPGLIYYNCCYSSLIKLYFTVFFFSFLFMLMFNISFLQVYYIPVKVMIKKSISIHFVCSFTFTLIH